MSDIAYLSVSFEPCNLPRFYVDLLSQASTHSDLGDLNQIVFEGGEDFVFDSPKVTTRTH